MSRRLGGAEGGFTLIEALAAVAVMAAIVGALASVSGQWLPRWRHGFLALQGVDQVAQTLDRLVADLASAEYARLDPGKGPPSFRGSPDLVIFVRAASGPGAAPKLEYVRIGAVATKEGMQTQRARAPFAPGPIGPFRDAVAVLHPPYRLSFAYEAPNGLWTSSWGNLPTLPRAIRLTVKAGDALVTSTAFSVKTTSGPDLSPPSSQDNDKSSGTDAK